MNPLLQVLLDRHSMPQLLVMVIHPCPLPSEKVLVIPIIHVLFIIFLAITSCLLRIILFHPQCLLLPFQKMWMKYLKFWRATSYDCRDVGSWPEWHMRVNFPSTWEENSWMSMGLGFRSKKDIYYWSKNLFILLLLDLICFFAVGVVSQFLHAPCIGHWNSIICILRYLRKARQGLLYEDKGSI